MPNAKRRTKVPTTGRRMATLSGGTPSRNKCTAKIPDDPQRHAAATASAYPSQRPFLDAAPVMSGQAPSLVPVDLIEKQVNGKAGYGDVGPDRESPSCESAVRTEAFLAH